MSAPAGRSRRATVVGRYRGASRVAIAFSVLALAAGLLGAGGMTGSSGDIAERLVIVSLTPAVISLLVPGRRGLAGRGSVKVLDSSDASPRLTGPVEPASG